MIRPAKFGDIQQLYGLLEEMHGRSRYAQIGHINEKLAKGNLMSAIQRHGGSISGSTNALVCDLEGHLNGMIIGVLVPIYDLGVELMGTDLWFYVRPGTPAHEAIEMLDDTIAWASASPHVRVLRFGVTDAIGDFKRAGKLYERRGFRLAGALYERNVTTPMKARVLAGEFT